MNDPMLQCFCEMCEHTWEVDRTKAGFWIDCPECKTRTTLRVQLSAEKDRKKTKFEHWFVIVVGLCVIVCLGLAGYAYAGLYGSLMTIALLPFYAIILLLREACPWLVWWRPSTWWKMRRRN